MELPLRPGHPILVPRIRLVGPKAARIVDLFLDTGAHTTLLAREVLREIGVGPSAVRRKVPMVTANGVVRVPLVHIPAVEMAGLRLKNLPVLCHDIPELAEASGLLGLNVLEHFVTTLDYHSRKLSIQPLRKRLQAP